MLGPENCSHILIATKTIADMGKTFLETKWEVERLLCRGISMLICAALKFLTILPQTLWQNCLQEILEAQYSLNDWPSKINTRPGRYTVLLRSYFYQSAASHVFQIFNMQRCETVARGYYENWVETVLLNPVVNIFILLCPSTK